MAKKTSPLLPATNELLRQFADRLRLARLRRRLPARQVAERAGMSPMTLRSLERGGSGVTIGAYLAIMQVLGVERDLDLLGLADPVGRQLQDAQLPLRAHKPVGKPLVAMPPLPVRQAIDQPHSSKREIQKRHEPSSDGQQWIKKSGFASADALAALIKSMPPTKKEVR